MATPSGPQFSVKYTLTGPDGTVATFNETTDPNFVGYITEITGLDSPEVRQNSENISGADGGIHGSFWYGRRPVTLQGNIINMKSAAERNAKLTKLKAACNAMRQDATLEWTPEGGEKQYMNLRLAGPVRITGGWAKEFQVPMVSASPYIYSVAEQQATESVEARTANLANTSVFKMVATPDNAFVYALSTAVNKLYVFKVNTTKVGGVEQIEVLNPAAGAEPQGMCISPDGKHIYVTVAGSKVVVYAVEASGKLVEKETKVLGAENKLLAPVVSPDNKNFYCMSVKTTATKNTSVFQCLRTPSSGVITVLTPEKIEVYSAAEGPDMAMAPQGGSIAVLHPVNAVYGLRRSLSTGLLSKESPESYTIEGGVVPTGVIWGPESLGIYVRTTAETLYYIAVSYNHQEKTRPVFKQSTNVKINGPMVVSGDGDHLYAAYGGSTKGLGVWTRLAATGEIISPSFERNGGGRPKTDGTGVTIKSILLMPNEKYIYATSGAASPWVFDARNSVTGVMSNSFSNFTITNNGGAESYPVITITGKIKNPVIINTKTGEAFFLEYSLSDEEQLVVDTANRTVTVGSFYSVYSSVIWASSTWFPLYPGANEYQFMGEEADGVASIKVAWRNSWV